MTRRVTLSPAAAWDLAKARDWLRQPGAGGAAVKRLRSIRSAIRDLKTEPCRWGVKDHPGVREIPVAGYTVMYQITPDTDDNETAGDVDVLRVFGPGQLRDRL